MEAKKDQRLGKLDLSEFLEQVSNPKAKYGWSS